MGGLCGSMAELVGSLSGDQGESNGGPEAGKKSGDETWEDEIDMTVFYKDAAKYWEVCI